jgi:polyferredoxin
VTVERWIEGDRNARMKLDSANWTAQKLAKRTVKHLIWLLIAIATGGAWIFYFADAPTLLGELFHGTAAPIAYITIAILTARPIFLAASCESRFAPICAPGRAFRPRCSTSTRSP